MARETLYAFIRMKRETNTRQSISSTLSRTWNHEQSLTKCEPGKSFLGVLRQTPSQCAQKNPECAKPINWRCRMQTHPVGAKDTGRTDRGGNKDQVTLPSMKQK